MNLTAGRKSLCPRRPLTSSTRCTVPLAEPQVNNRRKLRKAMLAAAKVKMPEIIWKNVAMEKWTN